MDIDDLSHKQILVMGATSCFCVFSFLFAVGYSSYLIHLGNHFNSLDIPVINNVIDIPQDWSTVPYTDLRVATNSCPSGYESIFERIWQGTTIGCQTRSGLFNSDPKIDVNDDCNNGEGGNGGDVCNPWPTIKQ